MASFFTRPKTLLLHHSTYGASLCTLTRSLGVALITARTATATDRPSDHYSLPRENVQRFITRLGSSSCAAEGPKSKPTQGRRLIAMHQTTQYEWCQLLRPRRCQRVRGRGRVALPRPPFLQEAAESNVNSRQRHRDYQRWFIRPDGGAKSKVMLRSSGCGNGAKRNGVVCVPDAPSRAAQEERHHVMSTGWVTGHWMNVRDPWQSEED